MLILGWLGQLAYFGRSGLQWLQSEREGRSLLPRGYWEISLLGSVLLGSYALLRQDPVILIGQLINAAIYLRNLHIQFKAPAGAVPKGVRILIAVALGGMLVLLSQMKGGAPSNSWALSGWIGQSLFLCRFPIQWWHIENSGRQELPPAFWYMSFFGSLLLLFYALSRSDWVICSGQATGLLMYGRNLWLLQRPLQEPVST